MNYEDVLLECETRMEEAIETLEKRFTNVRAGRANASMLDGIMVEYYGASTPLKQLANVSVPEARQLMIKPFDKGILEEGKAADIVVFNPNEEYIYTKEMIVSKSKNSPFIDKKLKGKVKYTIVNGKVVYKD